MERSAATLSGGAGGANTHVSGERKFSWDTRQLAEPSVSIDNIVFVLSIKQTIMS